MSRNYHNYRDSKGRFAKRPESSKFEEIKTERKSQFCPFCLPNIDYESDPKDFFEGEPHNGKPEFVKIEKNKVYTFRLVGDFIGFRQQFPNMNHPVRRYFVSVIDFNDEKPKILTCGTNVMKQIHNIIEAKIDRKKIEDAKLWNKLSNWINRVIWKKQDEPETVDFTIVKDQPTPNPIKARMVVKEVNS